MQPDSLAPAANQGAGALSLFETRNSSSRNPKLETRNPFFCLTLLWGGCWLLPAPVWAIQTHGDPEGLYVHQIGHLLFLAAMAYIIWQIHRRKLTDHLGFRQLIRGAYFLAAWNLLAFIGHMAEEKLPREVFLPGTGYFFRQIEVRDLNALLYYLAKLDHLILVPALFFFYLSLCAFRRQPPPREERE